MWANPWDTVVASGAALSATALEAIGRLAWSGPYLPELMAQKLFALVPLWAFTPLFRLFGHNAKYYAFAGMVAAEVGSLTLVGAVARGWMRGHRPAAGRWSGAGVSAAAGALGALILVGVLPLLDGGVVGQALPGGAWVAIPTFVAVAGCYVAVLTRGLRP